MSGRCPSESTRAHARTGEAVTRALGTDPEAGLSAGAVKALLARHGPNELPLREPPGLLRRVGSQLRDGMMMLLLGATAISLLVGERADAVVIASIVVLNALLGAFQEGRAEAAAAALRDLAPPHAQVLRGGRPFAIEARGIVTGDVVLLGTGDRVPADARLLQARNVEVDASMLTGESEPVAKRAEPPATESAQVADHVTMLHAGTTIVRGDARGVVTATAARTQLGQIAALTGGQERKAPLQLRLDHLSGQLLRLAAGVCLLLAVVAWLQGDSLGDSALVGVSLAVASVPEGLASVVTMTLALGMRRLARQGAIVRRLRAVEALGSVTVICTDKTGTLTRNQMRLEGAAPACGETQKTLIQAALTAVDEHPTPEDAAIRAHARDAGVERDTSLATVEILPFDTALRMVAVTVEMPDGGRRTFAKGAPEALAPRLADRATARRLLVDAADLGEGALRVLAVMSWSGGLDAEAAHGRLLGLMAFEDPLRADAIASVEAARHAGIRTMMLTGDHAGTARAVAQRCGLVDDANGAVVTGEAMESMSDAEVQAAVGRTAVLARISPPQKLQVVQALQATGEVVAVTGDGVNDAPALSAADVGVAMGRGGTDAARDAADVVLTDNAFATIVTAIEGGRTIRRNIVHFLQFLLAANLGEVLTFAAAILPGYGAPVSVVQILVVNLLTDGLPALALGLDPPTEDMLAIPPSPRTELLAGRWRAIGVGGAVTALACFTSFLIGRADSDAVAHTMTFATLTLSQLALVLAIRTEGPARDGPPNRWLTASLLGSVGVVALMLWLPPAQDLTDAVPLDPSQMTAALVLAAVPFAVLEAGKWISHRTSR